MIENKRLAAQGDVLFRRIPALPPKVGAPIAHGRVVVAHSETGHDHVVEGEVRLFARHRRLFEHVWRDSFISFLSVDGAYADVIHLRPHDTHKPLRLVHGVWEVRRQREWSPKGVPQPVID
jgi:hypothetical protein